ncbi:MAG: hypothetical protein KFF73_11275 [Cyclobacteriaceae bacterium]|nr:hypothetical protein [Cyclobacteriaceae bacterium]
MEYTGRHTYLFETGKWKAIGTYFDENGIPVNVTGESSMDVTKKIWTLHGFMELQLDDPIKIFNRYIIKPFDPQKDHTTWISENPALGKLKGRFTIVNDMIISQYQSEDGKFSGSEVLLFIDDDQYQNWGVVFENDFKISSWEVMLERFE